MRRYFLRPLFDFHDPFFHPVQRIAAPAWRFKVRTLPNEAAYQETQDRSDPHAIFEQFFKEHEPKHEAEKDFFRKHFPEKVEEKFDPYRVLELNKDATIDQVKDAYRNLAIKYHPKNNAQPDAEAKFAEVANAYQAIIDGKKSRDYGELGFKSFFEDFEKEIDEVFRLKTAEESKDPKEKKDTKQAKEEDRGELYSESSHYETVNGQQTKYVIEKIYKKDGKLLTVRREEKLKDDGKIEITETIDNGQEVKKKSYIQERDVKKISA